jgi:hypothetical protein
MKTNNLIQVISFLMVMATAFTACKDTFVERHTYTANVPQYMSYDQMREPVTTKAASAIGESGKICIQGNYLFVNEKYKGIHVFDNSNPAAPVNISFIEIPGNVDLAVKGFFLYADSYVDLVVINIRDIANPVEITRLKDVFPYTIPMIDNGYPLAQISESKGVITGWEVREITEDVDNSGNAPYYYYNKAEDVFFVSSGGAIPTTQAIGIGGSLARFIIFGDYFYGLNETTMQVVDITNPVAPVIGSKLELNRMVETVFIDSSYLFVGTQTGMLIYNLVQPSSPSFITQYDHFQSCDPVVVQDNYAYITMRAGNNCGNFQNAMDVVDLHSISNPQLVKTYPMTEPYGLGIDNKKLFVCDGSAGLKVYDASDPLHIDEHLVSTFTGLFATDVIPYNNVLIMIAADGIYQYDYTDLSNLVLLSKINIGK